MDKNNVLSLDLNETLFFEEGYEIDEMMSISIDPEISIQSFNDYVSIRGVVELEGEYIKLSGRTNHAKSMVGENDPTDKVFARAIEKSDEKIYFKHHFPVDISIPLNRIRSLEDVTVSVKAFDYTLTEPNELQIISTLNINGVHREKQKEDFAVEKPLETPNIQLDDTFQFKVIDRKTMEQAKRAAGEKNKKTTKQSDDEVKELTRGSAKQQEKIDSQKKILLNEKDEETINDDRIPSPQQKESKRKEDITVVGKDEITTSRLPDSTVETEKETVEPSPPDVKKHRDSQILESVDKISHTTEGIKVEEQPAIDQDSSSEDVQLQDITYLADIFESPEEVEPYQMRLCIVQKDDTLHSIAERYEIPTQQIVHLNKLDDEQVLDGQLLLIPTEK